MILNLKGGFSTRNSFNNQFNKEFEKDGGSVYKGISEEALIKLLKNVGI